MWFLTRSPCPRSTTVLAWDALLSAVAATGPLAADVSGPACATGDRVLRVVRGGSRFDIHFGYEADLPAVNFVAVIARDENVTRPAKGKWPGPDEG